MTYAKGSPPCEFARPEAQFAQQINVNTGRPRGSGIKNPYWQQFCGMSDFQWELSCDPSDLVYFRQRIGEQGVALILAVSAQMHGERAKESEVVIDSTVQEKNVTYPLDIKQYRKIILRCWKLADKSAVRLRRRYRKEVRACIMAQRLRKDPRRRKAARRGHRRLRIIAGALIRRLPAALREEQRENFTLYRRLWRSSFPSRPWALTRSLTGVLAGSARCPTGRALASQPSSLRLFAPLIQRRIRLTSPSGLRPVAGLYYALC